MPKFKSLNSKDQDYFDLWLRFLTEIHGETREIPSEFLAKQELSDAVKCVEAGSLTEEELDLYDRVRDAILVKKLLMKGSREEGFEAGEAKGRKEGRVEGRAEGEAKGRADSTFEIVQNLKQLGIPMDQISKATGLSVDEIERLSQSR